MYRTEKEISYEEPSLRDTQIFSHNLQLSRILWKLNLINNLKYLKYNFVKFFSIKIQLLWKKLLNIFYFSGYLKIWNLLALSIASIFSIFSFFIIAPVVEGVTEDRFEKCCGLGTSWAKEGLRCEKFIGPVPGVPTVEQGPCQKTVDICCVRKYHDLQCEKGKTDARQGLPCVSNVTSTRRTKITSRSDYHRDCCEGCKLGDFGFT